MPNPPPLRSAWSILHEAAWALQLPHLDKLLMLALVRHVDDYGRAWPGVGTLVRMTGAAQSTIVVHIDKLEKASLIELRGFVQFRGSEWQVQDGVPYTPGRTRLKLYRVLPTVDLTGAGETGSDKGPGAGPIINERVREPESIVDTRKGPGAGGFTAKGSGSDPGKGPAAVGPNSPVNPNSPARPLAGSREEAVASRSTSPFRGTGPPTPITTQLVIDSIASQDPGLAAVLRRNAPPPAGAAPSSSEPAAPDNAAPQPPQR
jgi:DNA-binding transcriptional ArsR family regulator